MKPLSRFAQSLFPNTLSSINLSFMFKNNLSYLFNDENAVHKLLALQ